MTSRLLSLDALRYHVRYSGHARTFIVALAGMSTLALLPPALDAQQPARRPDVIFVPTPMEVVDSMLAVTRVTKQDRLFDLGSGDGRIVIAAAKRFGTRGIGIDIDPQRIEESRRNADTAGVKNLVEFRQADLFETDLRQATVITLYLLPTLNVKLRPKLFAELRPGTRVVSHAFNMGDWEPDRTLYAGGRTVYYWLMPANLDGTWTLTAPAGGSTRTYELRLTQNYQRLTGTATAGRQSLAVDSARVIGDSVVFTLADTASGASARGQRMRFAGRLSDGTLSGVVAGGSGRWRATKRGGH
ncbi:MAG TPA: class I SAM-dependent methyltransferase [Gemmatimonadaceae bacterium]|nr:class I SAM-dependent methyltransferase [Gemmatimonadaceae bacterium]